jgi:hypothetical protein
MLDEVEVSCPYCWQTISLLVDTSAGSQAYTEDCHVCCRPILVRLSVDLDGRSGVSVQAEDD